MRTIGASKENPGAARWTAVLVAALVGPTAAWGAVQAPTIGQSPTTLTYSVAEGFNPATQSFSVENTGGGTLNYTVTDNAAWLSTAPGSGSLTPGNRLNHTAAVASSALAVGVYAATITITDAGATNNPQTIAVTLTVRPKATIGLNPTSLTFTGTQNAPSPASQSATLSNTGPAGSLLEYTATSNQGWLSAAPANGTIGSGGSATLTIVANTSGLAAGSYNGQITFADPTATNGPQTLAVALTVLPQPAITLSTGTLSFDAVVGQPNPAAQSFNVQNSGVAGSTLTYTAAADQTWLALSPAGASLAVGSSTTHSAAVDASALSTGSYSATITVSDPNASNNPRTIAVTLTVRPQATLVAGPTSLSLEAFQGGAAVFGNVTVQNTGPAESLLKFTTSSNQPWLTALPSSASVAGGGAETVAVLAGPSGLATGTYTGTLTISDALAAGSPQNVVVTFKVKARGTIGLSATLVTFTAPQGGTVSAQSVVVSNTGAAGSLVNYAVSLAGGSSWLTLSPAAGSLASGAANTLVVAANPAGLAPGTYTDTARVTDPEASNNPRELLIILMVEPGSGSTTIFEENFRANPSGWNFQSTDPNIGFRGDLSPSTAGPYGTSSAFGDTGSVNYNNGSSYDNGLPNSGWAVSPLISLAGSTNPVLYFRCLWDTEPETDTNGDGIVDRDRRWVEISNDSFATVLLSENQSATLTTPGRISGRCAERGVWHLHALALNPAWGSIQVRFRFETVDAQNNTGAGWFIDDVKVAAASAVSSGGGSSSGSKSGGSGGTCQAESPLNVPPALALLGLLACASSLWRRP